LNAKLRRAESQLIDNDGLYRRPWYRHLVYGPGYYTGYGVKTIPGVREGIEDGRYGDAEKEVVRVSAALTRLTSLIDSASSELETLARQPEDARVIGLAPGVYCRLTRSPIASSH